ncbi:ABC transporter ATP-binding protein (plasmid) [Deinococcus aetherius]|uniref:ABC transporter ATP-binding protein n=1 Tax=Deinococcus aetherius TaxID=200252 RepID=A0ABM8AIU6_9DEIO|nr:ABC transporter ATP-binding protein [Deinococcus aetherius]BDP43703.1 ABC transporter ATP-binding protein [Deinococcus aetherius]
MLSPSPGQAPDTTESALLTVAHLKKYYPVQAGFLRKTVGYVKAVDDVSFTVQRGETLGLVGESGCGKTTLGRTILRALDPTAGYVGLRLPGGETVDLARLGPRELRAVRRHAQMVFQDPYSSLNPRMTVLDTVSEPLRLSGMAQGPALVSRVKDLLHVVGLEVRHLNRYPHAFSGGQRQRIGIARALATNPSLIVADEAVSALDVSIQAQILNLMQDLQREFGLAYLFISHDLSVIEHLSDRVAVMYVGQIVERAGNAALFSQPLHPYTAALLASKPHPDPRQRNTGIPLSGEIPDLAALPSGCPFHPRCPFAQDRCRIEKPPLREVHPDHFAACHFAGELPLSN